MISSLDQGWLKIACLTACSSRVVHLANFKQHTFQIALCFIWHPYKYLFYLLNTFISRLSNNQWPSSKWLTTFKKIQKYNNIKPLINNGKFSVKYTGPLPWPKLFSEPRRSWALIAGHWLLEVTVPTTFLISPFHKVVRASTNPRSFQETIHSIRFQGWAPKSYPSHTLSRGFASLWV